MTDTHHWTQPEPADVPPPTEYLPHADWRISDAVLAYIVGFIGVLLTSFTIFLAGFDIGSTAALLAVQTTLVAFAFWFLVRRSRVRGTGSITVDTGLTLRLRDWWAVPLAFVLQIVIGLISTLVAFLVLGEEAPFQEIGEIVLASDAAFDMVALGFLAVVLAPLLEEVLFRGVLLRGLLRRFGVVASIVISALAFSLTHIEALDIDQVPVVVDTFLWGVVLAWFTLRSGNLSVAILLHASSNLLAVVALFAL